MGLFKLRGLNFSINISSSGTRKELFCFLSPARDVISIVITNQKVLEFRMERYIRNKYFSFGDHYSIFSLNVEY